MDADRYILGLDLGQKHSFTALVALQRQRRNDRYFYTVRGIRRWPLGSLYSTIANDVSVLTLDPPLRNCVLGVDRSGVGAGVVEIIKEAHPEASLKPITITGGLDVRPDGTGYRVPRTELVAAVDHVLQSGRLEIPADYPESATLAAELKAFDCRPTAKAKSADEIEWRSRPHDDLVLALAIALWLDERSAKAFYFSMPDPGPSDTDDSPRRRPSARRLW